MPDGPIGCPYMPTSFGSDLKAHFSEGESSLVGRPGNVLGTLYLARAIVTPHHAQLSRTAYLRNARRLNPLLGMAIGSEIAHIHPPNRPVITHAADRFASRIFFLIVDRGKPTDAKELFIFAHRTRLRSAAFNLLLKSEFNDACRTLRAAPNN